MAANSIFKLIRKAELAEFRVLILALSVGLLPSLFLPAPQGWANETGLPKFTCPKVKTKKFDAVIQELIEMDLSGARQQTPSSCLDQKNFKYIVASHDPPGEAPVQYKPVPEDYRVQISSTEEVDHGSYTTKFKVESPGKEFSQEDTLIWMLVLTPERQKKDGCALVLQYPSKPLIRKKCETN